MYARLVLFTLGPEMRSTAEKIIIDEMNPKIKDRKGFKNLNFLGDDEAESTVPLFCGKRRRMLSPPKRLCSQYCRAN